MKIIVDTCIWSLALRRSKNKSYVYVDELGELIKEVRVQMIGPVRQEILSGIKTPSQFSMLKQHLAAFIDLPLSTADFELAAEYFNKSRGKGIQGSNTDFLICAVSHRHKMPIFTTDKDFEHFSTILPIQLYKPR